MLPTVIYFPVRCQRTRSSSLPSLDLPDSILFYPTGICKFNRHTCFVEYSHIFHIKFRVCCSGDHLITHRPDPTQVLSNRPLDMFVAAGLPWAHIQPWPHAHDHHQKYSTGLDHGRGHETFKWRSENSSLEMRWQYSARSEVMSGTYMKQLHRNTADAAIHPTRTSYLGVTFHNTPDTFMWMASNVCFSEMCFEGSHWSVVFSVGFTRLSYVCRRVDLSIHLSWQMCSLWQSVVVCRISLLVPIYGGDETYHKINTLRNRLRSNKKSVKGSRVDVWRIVRRTSMMPVVVSKLWLCDDGILFPTHHVPGLTFRWVCVIHEVAMAKVARTCRSPSPT